MELNLNYRSRVFAKGLLRKISFHFIFWSKLFWSILYRQDSELDQGTGSFLSPELRGFLTKQIAASGYEDALASKSCHCACVAGANP